MLFTEMSDISRTASTVIEDAGEMDEAVQVSLVPSASYGNSSSN